MANFITAKEVAQLFGRSEKWVYQNKKAIPGMFHLGKSYFWDKDLLLATIKDLATTKKPDSVRRAPTGKHGII